MWRRDQHVCKQELIGNHKERDVIYLTVDALGAIEKQKMNDKQGCGYTNAAERKLEGEAGYPNDRCWHNWSVEEIHDRP